MNRDFVRKAKEMLRDNRRRHRWQALAAVAGAVVAVVCAVSLMYPAHALTGGDSLRSAITDDSALYYKAADSGDDAWQKVDASTPIAADSSLRLRIAFTLPAGTLANGAVLQYQLPDGVKLDASRGTVAGDLLAGATVADPTNQDATTIGSYEVKDGILTVTFNDDVATENAGTTADASTSADASDSSSSAADATDATQAQEGKELSAYVDLDLGFDELTTDSDGLATIQLNDSVKLQVTKAAEKSEETAAAVAPATSRDASAGNEAASQDAVGNAETTPADTTAESTSSSTPAASAEAAADNTEEAAAGTEPTAETSENDASTSASQDSTESQTNTSAEAQSASAAQLSTLSASSAKPSLGVMLRAAATETKIDGASHLTKVTIKKKAGDHFEPATSFSDGDEIQTTLDFHFDKDIIKSGSQTVTYQLPNGIRPTKAVTGAAIYDNGKQVGTVDVDESGLVTMHFSDSYATGNAINAEVYFDGTVSSSGADSNGQIHFQDGSSITIVKPSEPDNHDISITKKGSINSTHTGADYTLTVSTTNGTGGAVTVMDTLNWSNNIDYKNNQSSKKNQFYDHEYGTPVVTKVAADGTRTIVPSSSYTLEWTTDDGTDYGKPRFVIRNLPELAANEKYEITYKALFHKTDANADAQINNAATAYRPKGHADTNQAINWNTDDQKTGTYDAGSKTIHWTITANRNKKNANGLIINDTLPNDLEGDVVVKDNHGNTIMTLNEANNWYDSATGSACRSKKTLWIKLPSNLANPTDQYTIEYKTKVTGTTGTEKVSNSATTHYSDGSGNTAASTVDVNHQETWDIKKELTTLASENNTGYLGDGVYRQAWKTTVSMPESAVDSFTITDTIADATASDGTPLGTDSHYAVASELYQELYQYGVKLTMRDTSLGTLYTDYQDNDPIKMMDSSYAETDAATVQVRMYDANGSLVDRHSSAHVKKFEVTITPKQGTKISGTSTTLTYSTKIDTTSAPDGTTVTAGNNASTKGQTTHAETKYKKTDTFQKQVLSGVNSDKKELWTDGTKSIEYNKTDPSQNKATFRILVDTTHASGDITVTDTLPKGMSFVPGTAALKKYQSEYYDPDVSSLLTTSTSQDSEGRTVITFKIKDGYDRPAQLYIRYDASFADDTSWNDEAKTDQSYVNTAQWNSSTSTSTISVHREPERMMKIGAQEMDANGNPTNKVKYHIIINPKAEDLNPTSDYLDLTDVLTANSALQPQLDIQGVVLNGYSDTAADHVDTSVVYPTKTYTVSYDSKTHTLRAKIPDQAACVLTYEYELKGNYASGASISNSASLDGKWSKGTSTSLDRASAGGSATKGEFYLYKVDSENYQDKLSGAVFDLYSGKGGSFTKTLSNVNVDQRKEWDLLDSSSDQAIFEHDVLYKFVETKAPDGYKISDMPTYVVWLSDGETEDSAWSAIQSSGILKNAKKADGTTQITKDDIQFIPNAGGSIYVTNEYTRLTVDKQWLASDGSPLDESRIPSSSIQVKLMQDVVKPGSGCTVTATCVAYNTTYKTSALVTSGSSIKVVVPDNSGQTSAKMVISLDGGTTWTDMRYDELTKQWYYTIDSVTSDMNVTYKSNGGLEWMCQKDPILSDYTKPDDVVTSKDYATVTLNAKNGWSYTWNDLSKQDANGNSCTYHVEELNPGSGYRVSYLNNGSITRGTITVTNTMLVTLPATGGSGTSGFVLGGAAVAAMAAIALLVRRMRRSE